MGILPMSEKHRLEADATQEGEYGSRMTIKSTGTNKCSTERQRIFGPNVREFASL